MSAITLEETAVGLTHWLAATSLGPKVRLLSLTPAVGAGFSAETSFVQVEDDDGRRENLVLRRQIEGSELFLGSDLRLPYRMMEALAAHPAVPVPVLIGIEFDCAVLGTPFLVMRHVEGRVVHQSPNYNKRGWVYDLPRERRGELWHNALRTMAEIHKLDWREGFDFLDRPERGRTGLAQYLNWVEEWYLWARGNRPHPVTDCALEYLKRNRPPERRIAVLWGDATPSNILFRDDLSVGAVIDWEMATLGPPEADVAWWLFFDDLFSTGMGTQRLPGLPDRATSISWYESFAGYELENMDYYDVLATFRMAIVGMRAVDRQIGLGRIPATTTARTHAPIMRMLAGKVGEPLPEVGRDFFDFMTALGMH